MSENPPEKMPDLPGSDAITKSAKSNLALSFAALPKAERDAMSVFYAFCRVVDDVADSTELPIEEKTRQLGEWRKEVHRAYMDTPLTPLGREMQQIIRTYLIAPTPLEEILNGMEMDMSIMRYPSFASLEQYCYRVASARLGWSASTSSVAARRRRATTQWRLAWRSSSRTFCAM